MADPLFSIRGLATIVSGASRGIGRAIAAGFAERGAPVIITGRELGTLEAAAAEMRGAGRTVVPVACDVADDEAIPRLVEAALRELGGIDVLINVAGVNRRLPAETLRAEDFDFVVDINLRGPFLLSLAVGRHMLERGRGSQINITSLNNDRPLANVLPYAVSKVGLGHMTKALALEWGPRGVRVNAIAPGFILTDLTKGIWSDARLHAWGLENTPLRRIGEPQDLVGAAVFLASPAAAFLTGQVIYVDGGFTCGTRWPLPPPAPRGER